MRSTTNHILNQYADSKAIEKIAKKIKSGDNVILQVAMGGWGSSQIAVLQIVYCNSDRVWYVKPMIGRPDELVHAEFCEEHRESGEMVAADSGLRSSLAGMIEEANNAIRNKQWVATVI